MTRKVYEQVRKEPFYIVFDEEFVKKEFSCQVFKNSQLGGNDIFTAVVNNSKQKKSGKCARGIDVLNTTSDRKMEPTRGLWQIIDLAMELQQNLFEISSNTISTFQLQLLLIILEAFVAIVFNCYYILSIFYNPAHFRLAPNEAALFLAYQLLQPIMNLLAITITCMMTIRAVPLQTETTQQIVNKLIISTKDIDLRQRLSQFSMQIKSSTPVFNVLGLFNIDGNLLFSIIASTTTYLVILVQYTSAVLGDKQKIPLT